MMHPSLLIGRAAAAALLGLLAVAPAQADTGPGASPAPSSLRYEVYLGGVKALAFETDIAVTAGGYRVRMAGRTQGMLDWIFDWVASAVTEGQVSDGRFRPLRHDTESVLRGAKRDVRMGFRPDGSIDLAVNPPNEADEREPVTPEQQRGALDPLSALLNMARTVDGDGRCDGTVAVFDGRRRYDLIFHDHGTEPLKRSDYNVFDGTARLCMFQYKRIAGYQKAGSNRWNNPRDAERTFKTWVAPVISGLPPLPVRIEADGSFGLLVVHLVGTGRAAAPG